MSRSSLDIGSSPHSHSAPWLFSDPYAYQYADIPDRIRLIRDARQQPRSVKGTEEDEQGKEALKAAAVAVEAGSRHRVRQPPLLPLVRPIIITINNISVSISISITPTNQNRQLPSAPCRRICATNNTSGRATPCPRPRLLVAHLRHSPSRTTSPAPASDLDSILRGIDDDRRRARNSVLLSGERRGGSRGSRAYAKYCDNMG
ncbi:hypothetical protein PG991_016314 [Apiospora marii]|uniref:Uncharacterized protein n=1 Tax=Apiospora marii TaxID=335849 RepID=A0ABR1QZQ9_9PEZI